MKRLLSCNYSDIVKMNKKDKIRSIAASEGRTLVSEVIGAFQPLLYDISNAELACAFGADILLLNIFDVYNPIFNGIPDCKKDDVIREIKNLTGRMIGINLEPVDDTLEVYDKTKISEGRVASAKTAKKASDMGVDIIVLTGNPGTGVSNRAILNSLKEMKKEVGDKVIFVAGKMHSSGSVKESGQNIINKNDIKEFVEAGADIILMPAPGTVPGITVEYARELINFAHNIGALTMTSIGTSQEGSDSETIKNIAIMCKMAGTDIHHIGDTGYPGIAIPENIMDYSIAIRGKRHTYARMARSINR